MEFRYNNNNNIYGGHRAVVTSTAFNYFQENVRKFTSFDPIAKLYGIKVGDYLIEYYKSSMEKPFANPITYIVFYIFVIALFLFALYNLLYLKLGPDNSAYFRKFPYLGVEGNAIMLLFLATLLTSCIDGVTHVCVSLTALVFIFISLMKHRCNNLIRWPLLVAGLMLLAYGLFSTIGKFLSFAEMITNFFKYTSIISFVCILKCLFRVGR